MMPTRYLRPLRPTLRTAQRRLRPLWAVALLALGPLAGCAMSGGGASGIGPSASPTPAQTVFEMRGAYDAAFLAPAAHYNELPRCAKPAVTLPRSGAVVQPCSDPKVVDQLRKADAAAKALLDGAEDVARNHPELSAATAIAAANDAISAAEKALTVYAIK